MPRGRSIAPKDGRRSGRGLEEWERKRRTWDTDVRPYVSPRPSWPKEGFGVKNPFVVGDGDDDDEEERELITNPFADGDSNGDGDADVDGDIAHMERLTGSSFITEVDPQPDDEDEDDFQLRAAQMLDACTLDDIMAYVNANDSHEDASTSTELDPLSLRGSRDTAEELDDVELMPYGEAPEMRAGEMWAGGSEEPWTRGRGQKKEKGKGWRKWFGSCF